MKYGDQATRHISSASYDYVKPFGSDVKWRTLGTRPKFKPLNDNPPPTQYNPNYDINKPRVGNMVTGKS